VFDLNRSFLKKQDEDSDGKDKKSLSPESKKKKVNEFLTRMKGQMDRSTKWREEQARRKQEEEQAMLEQIKQSKFRASSIKYTTETQNEPEKLNLNIKTRHLKKSPSVNREVSLSRSQAEKSEQKIPRYAEALFKSELVLGANLEQSHQLEPINSLKQEIPLAEQQNSTETHLPKAKADPGDRKLRPQSDGFAVNLDGEISLNFRLK